MQKETLPTLTSLYGCCKGRLCRAMMVLKFLFSVLEAKFFSHLNLCKPKWIPLP